VPSNIPAPVIIAGEVIVGDIVSGDIDVAAAAGCASFANPKSNTFTTPSGVILTLAGFRSRWMMPCS
jgi:hypothetical protein